MRNSKVLLAGLLGASLLVVSACSQGDPADSSDGNDNAAEEAEADGDAEEPSAEAPAPFDDDGVDIAIVQNSGQGDYFQQYLNGTRQQVEALGGELAVYDAQGDNATQTSQLEQAISSSPDGIIVRHGVPDALCSGVNSAIDAGIPVIIYDVEIQECAPDAIQSQQSDAEMASLVLNKMVEDVGSDQDVGYVNVAGIAPLDRRDAVWQDYKSENSWEELFQTGTYTNSTATDTAPMVSNALRANPDVAAIYAPYDELTKGVLSALEQTQETNDDVLVYGADISTADIELMTAEDSAWVATGATDPNAIGAAVVRTLALHMADELDESLVEFPPILITQDFLLENDVSNMEDLREAEPALNIAEVSSADWIPVVTF